jgi:(1->4)-alpha-D-glucan 1-alpha-D-glucosylmutase
VASLRVPLATYRLQFNSRFTFRDAELLAAYLHGLGVSDCYASSYLAAVPGSPHGYDVADPTRLNPDIGTEADYWAWIDALRSRGMGHVLDIVPNHMGIAEGANPWWLDVLENGACSRYAHFFDIEWHPVKDELANKVLIPILGDQYGAALERQELTLEYDHGAFSIRHYKERIPIAPDTYRLIVRDALDAWLAEFPGQHADDLLSVLTAADRLPPRTSRDPDDIDMRAREKEVIKRRLAELTGTSAAVAALIDTCVVTLNGTAHQPRSFDRLDALLNAQSYRLAHWRVASEEINYRRFFDVNQLAALRMEDPAVFDEVHRFPLELVRRGAATGLRVDHVDGLYAPADYLRRLQDHIAASSPGSAERFYIVVEKILGAGESLPADWRVCGTTGYEFAAMVNGLFVDRRNERAFDTMYNRFVYERRERPSFGDLAYRSKKQVLHETMSGDINSLGHQLNRFSERNRHFRDYTLYSLISTIKEVIACFPVYRTYITADQPIAPHDRRYIVEAIHCAKRRVPGVASVVFDFIERLLLKETAVSGTEDCEARARFIGKFQQLTGPISAKAIEDTALYVYNRLLSLNEVGADPTVFGVEPADVHRWMEERQRRWPAALSTTATHDTKRGEDMRARLNALSEMPGVWKSVVGRWRAVNRRHKTEIGGVLAPDYNEEYFLYQTLVGAWPFDIHESGVRKQFLQRIERYMMKAMREAKVHSSWLSPNEEYEGAVFRFIDAILDRRRALRFFQLFEPFQARIAQLGIYNSLAQLAIKITAPCVPDFHQGGELWDLNLVDPDNRRPVDFERRRWLFDGLDSLTPSELLATRADGRVKMHVMHQGLCARAQFRRLFEEGDYVPLDATGARSDCLFAFARRAPASRPEQTMTITCVPRLIASLMPDGVTPPLGPAVWKDTRMELGGATDDGATIEAFRDVFTGAIVVPEQTAAGRSIAPATLFQRFPVALLVPAAV